MATIDDVNSQQKARIHRVATLGTGIFIHLMVCWTVLSIGHMNISPTELFALSSVAIAGFVFLALLIGVEWNLSLEDPDMAVAQMIWALTVVVITSHFALDLKAVVLLSGLAMVVMGANRLTRSQQIFVACYGLLIYMLSVVYLTNVDALGWVTEIVLIIAFALVLVFGPALYQFERNVIETVISDKNVELGKALEQIKELAVRDELTGVYNRRYLLDMLAREKAMADRKNDVFSVCYVDLDYFKKVNDRFGHATGDDVLRSFARVAEHVVREVDCVARMGGEEFVLVFAGTGERDAVRGAERLVAGLRDMHVTRAEPRYRVTVSVGITEYRQGDTIQQMLDRADRALYDAKRTGRNRMVVANGEVTSLSNPG
ncbi:MAG: diguanylate cyclase [Pseudomonadales bacterium]|nr:diguanylate cyclase [Pseudomonadales bacterium]MBO6596081.1 diguanylate cyclase [Pseudomonadales bacterium]MBO6702701.1 diguanylate cyclase [Pseudomonadales bacterium]MBO6822564.1 diguanylate cyclase [Pseudomonadales bacterium]MBO7004685.1 diguanylate cyclase [Pseudomonadales bacterium]